MPTFPIVLLLAGIGFILIGLIGRLRIRAFGEVGTDSTPARVVIFLFGIGLLIGAYLVYQSDKTTVSNGHTNANIHQTPSPTPLPEITITKPTPSDEPLKVKIDNGAAVIPVSGVLKGFPESDKASVYVFTSTGGSSEWWYNEAAKPNQDGSWNTEALSGSKEAPARPNLIVKIRAVFATYEELQKAKQDPSKKMVRDFSFLTTTNLSKEMTITITPSN